MASSPREAWRIEQLSTGGEPWRDRPVSLDSGIFGTTSDHRLTGIEWNAPTGGLSAGSSPSDQTNSIRVTIPGFSSESSNEHQTDTVPDSSQPSISKSQWSYQGFAIGQGPPYAFTARQNVFVISDGMQVAAFDSSTGRRQWWSGLADFPIANPALQACAFEDVVFAASQGTLRGVDLRSGSVRFERYLGDTSTQWRTTVAWMTPDEPNKVESAIGARTRASEIRRTAFSDERPTTGLDRSGPSISAPGHPKALIAAWPLTEPGTKPGFIRVCDIDTGVVLQQLTVDALPHELVIRENGAGILWTEGRLSGMKFAPPSELTATTKLWPQPRP
jgi:hypothetical protein